MEEFFEEFTKDVNNQQMSIHAYTLYVTGLVGTLTNRIKELETEIEIHIENLVGEDI